MVINIIALQKLSPDIIDKYGFFLVYLRRQLEHIDSISDQQLEQIFGLVRTEIAISKNDEKILIDTINSLFSLRHFGVLGMKWGIRKDDTNIKESTNNKKLVKKIAIIGGATLAAAGVAYLGYKIYKLNPGIRKITTSAGEQITTQPFQSRFGKILDGILGSQSPLNQKTAVIIGADKRKAGEIFYTTKKKSMHIDWIGVRESHRNKGYAKSVLEDMIKQAKSSGLSEITLDATGGADKLYSKLGFIQTGVASLETSYGIPMRLDLTKLVHFNEEIQHYIGRREDSKMQIDNKKESSVGGMWSNPGASLYDKLMNETNWNALIKEAYGIAPVGKIKNTEEEMTSFSASGVGYPHHVIRGGKLVLHRAGLRAAYSRAQQMGIVKGDFEDHMIKHYKEMGWYEESNISEDDETIEHTFSPELEPILKHFGILGMKWGVTNKPGQGGRAPAPTSKEHETKMELKKTPISEMTNAQLKAFNERLNLEQNYQRLKANDINTGQKMATNIISKIGNQILNKVIDRVTNDAMDKIFKKKGA